jgi:glycosyltransferase involved in cell wall biosynthesis
MEVELLGLSRHDDPSVERELRGLGVKVGRLGARGPRDVLAFLRLLGRIGASKYDLIHTHLPWAGFWGSLAGRIRHVPVVGTLYGYARAPEASGSPENGDGERRAAWALRRWARRVIAISGAQWDRYVGEGVFSRTMLEVVYQGVDVTDFSDPDPESADWLRKVAGFPRGGPVAVTVSDLDDLDNGVDVLLWAIPEILKAVPQARFVIAGDGALKGELQRRVRARGLNPMIHWTEEGDDIRRILAGADLFIHPTLRDPFPAEVLEGMAASLPVVGTAVGGVPEIIGSPDVGRLVPRANPDALARTVVELLRAPERLPVMGKAAHARVTDRFSARGWAERTEDIYRGVVREVRAGKPRPQWTYARLSVALLGRPT